MKKVSTKFFDAAIKDQINLDKFSLDLDKRIHRVLKAAQDEIVGALAKIDPSAPAMTKWKKARLEKLEAEISEILKTHYSEIKRIVKIDLTDLAAFQAENVVKSFNHAIGVELMDVTLTPEYLTAIVDNTMINGTVIGDWWTKQSIDVRNRTMSTIAAGTQALQIGMVQGESIGELIARIRGTALSPGVMTVTKRQATALVRTSIMQVANAVRQETYKANADVLKGIQIIATLDNRTTPLCRSLDGLQFDLDGNPIGHDRPFPGIPAHWNCRSSVIPLVRSWEELAGSNSKLSKKQLRELDKIPPGMKETLHDPIPVDMIYNEWLRTLPVAEQQEILGMKKWKLWSEKGLSVRDLLDNRGHELTLKELQVKYGR